MSMATASRATNVLSLADTPSGSPASGAIRSSGRLGRRQRGGAGRGAALLLPGAGLRLREDAGHLGQRLLLPTGQHGEVARQLEQEPLLWLRPGRLALAQPLEEVARLDPER